MMSRMVFCQKFKKEMRGLDAAPFPGPKGQFIFENISLEAWLAWQKHQTMLINEKHLNMMEKTARDYIAEQMDKFFAGDDYDHPEGYRPT